MVCGGVSGMGRAPRAVAEHLQRLVVAGAPATWRTRPGTTSTRPGVGASRHGVCAASRRLLPHWGSRPIKKLGGATRPVHASEVLTISAVRATATTACPCLGVRATPAMLPGSGIRLSSCAKPQHQGQPDHWPHLVYVAQ